MFEVEIRGVLVKKQFADLRKFLAKNGKFEKRFKRLSVEISPGFDPQSRAWSQSSVNLRVKKSDQEEKISLKYGDFAAESLEEHDIIFKPGQFLNTLQMFSRLGFDQGLIYFWESWVYEYQSAEVKISKYTDDYYMWEIEARGELDEEAAKEKVYQIAQELKLKPLTRDEYQKEIAYQCHHIFQLYSQETVKELLGRFSDK